jgi:hypothetical protein
LYKEIVVDSEDYPGHVFRFGLKIDGDVFSGLTLKSVVTVSSSLSLKSVVRFLIEAQNQGGRGFTGL